MATPRLPLLSVDEAGATAAGIDLDDRKGQSSLYRVLLHHPQLARRISDLIDTLMADADLDARLRELVVMRIGWTSGCVYTWTQHWRIAQHVGVEQRDLLAVRDWENHDHWSGAERVALRATDEILADRIVSPETWDQCAKAFPAPTQQLELMTTISSWAMMSELLRSLAVPLEDGVAPWPPDGVTPTRFQETIATDMHDEEIR
ncbi:MAG: carboxymuconolactone decarboxylase family protein [Actinomycetota bacterium]